jgi:type IV pilus assembly protein PilA
MKKIINKIITIIKRRKGFTLIELLAVIVVLSIVLVIAVPAIGNIIKNSRQDAYDTLVKLIEDSTKKFVFKNPNYIPKEVNNTTQVTIGQLVAGGFLERVPKDPRTDELINENNYVIITKIADNKYTYVYMGTPSIGAPSSLTFTRINNIGNYNTDVYNGVKVDSAGNYIAVGFTLGDLNGLPGGGGTNGGHDLVIAKHDSNLNLIKISNIGGSLSEYYEDLAIDAAGNYIAVGYSASDLSELTGGSTNKGSYDFVIAKYDSDLNLIKISNLGGSLDDRFNSVSVDKNGNYIAVGYSASDLSTLTGGSTNSGGNDFIIAKFDSSLNLIKISNVAGTLDDQYNSVLVDAAGNYIAVGCSKSDLSTFTGGSTNSGDDDFVIAKYDSNLNLIKINNAGSQFLNRLSSVAVDAAGNYIAVGMSGGDLTHLPGGSPISTSYDIVIIKYNSNLDISKVNNGITGGDYAFLRSVVVDTQGNYVAVGGAEGADFSSYNGGNPPSGDRDFLVVRYKSDLNLDIINNTGKSEYDEFDDITVNSNRAYIMVGSSISDLTDFGGSTNNGFYDFVISKIE